MDQNPSKLIPALVGGAVIAVLSSFPIISAGNCLCCMWVIGGGFLAVYLYKKDLPEGAGMTQGDALLIGLIAGVFGALFATLINYFFLAIGFKPGMAFLESILESREDISPEVKDMLNTLRGESFIGPMLILSQLVIKLFIYSLFSMIGGVIGGAVFNKKQKEEKTQ